MRKFLTMCLGLAMLVLAVPTQVFAQSGKFEVKGVVVDAAGNPIIGATVVEQGTANGITTDFNGQFVLKVKSGQSIVSISYIGYLTKSYAAISSELQRVVLEEDSAMIDDVVVIGYGTVKKNDLTGSVVAIKADDINRGAIVSTQDMMQGKVPGLQVIPGDGGPNSGATMRIRGISSFKASQNPLIVIDGVPVADNAGAGMANPLSLVNPNDIESFTVLKDASAAAIYGSRASNGVIIITTKKGKGNKMNVSYNGSFSVSHNFKEMPVMTADEFRSYLTSTYAEGTPQGNACRALLGDANTNWQDLVFRTGLSHDHNVSIYGNYDNGLYCDELPYRASLGYTSQLGTLETSKYDRATADLSLAPKFFNEHLTVSLNAKGVYNHQDYADSGAIGGAAFMNPTQDPFFRNDDGSIDYTTANGYWNYGTGRGSNFAPNSLAGASPLSLLYDRVNYVDVFRALGNFTLDYKVHGLEALRFNLNLGMDWSKNFGYDGVRPGSFQAYKDTTILKDENGNVTNNARGWGQYSKSYAVRSNKVLDFYGNYNETWGDHNLDAMVGYSWQNFYQNDQSFSYFNETDERNTNNQSLLYQEESFLVSFYSRLNYSYDSRYLLTFTLRADGSSKFSKDNRWGYFPSAAFAWNVKEEAFLEDSEAISTLKFRLGYGETGQQEIGNYRYLARYGLSASNSNMANMGNAGYNYFWTPYAYDPNITWETTITYNVGIDFGFLDGRINGSVDVYRRDTRDLLNEVTTPLGANFGTTLLTNIGSMRNQGIEFSLDVNPVRTQNWNLRIGFNGTYQQTEFIKLNNTNDPSYAVYDGKPGKGTGGADLTMHTVGSKPYTFYTYQQIYDENGKPIQNAFVDRNKNGQLDKGDRYNTGKSSLPDFFFGLNLKLSYKNWDFGFNGHGSIGNYVFNDLFASNSTISSDVNSGILSNYATSVFKTGWVDGNSQEQWYSDAFLENASFFRMDDINLGYTFDKIGNSDMKLRLAAGVQNVFVITNYSGIDPEVSSSTGIDGAVWPRPRIYSLRVNLNF